jgi:hypothetical protein
MPFIYAMRHPLTLEIRYIGKANKPLKRFREHRYLKRELNSHKKNWVASLAKEGLKADFLLIEEVSQEEWKECERFWIKEFRSKNFRLLNATSGGDGLSCGNQTSFKKGDKAKPVFMFTKQRAFVQEFSSLREAAEYIKGSSSIASTYSGVQAACCGKKKTCKKHIFIYK